MIRKCLIISKHIYLQNDMPEALDEQLKPIEILLPVEQLWILKKYLKELDYLVASNEPGGDVKICQTKIYRFIHPYAVQEKDRNWLNSRIDRDEL